MIETDCVLPSTKWKQQQSKQHAKIDFQTGRGTKILIAKPLEPAFVITELQPSVRIKSNRAGAQLMVRVVLPQSKSSNGTPLTTHLAGPTTYTNSPNSQTLGFKPGELLELLRKRLWLLRHEHGPEVTIQNAYVDQMVLNVYGGPGATQLEIDQVAVAGAISAETAANASNPNRPIASSLPATAKPTASGIPTTDSNAGRHAGRIRQATFQGEQEKHPAIVQRSGSVLEIEGKPFFPKVVQHNGESFEFLKSLGFNTVHLRGPASHGQLQTAKQLDMWIVCPPPPTVGVQMIPLEYDRVLAWNVGTGLGARELNNVQQQIHAIKQSDSRQSRPIFANVTSHWNAIAPAVDVVSSGRSPFGTSFIASGYSNWIQQRSAIVAHAKPIWADIQTQLPRRTEDQISSIFPMLPPISLQPQQVKFAIYEAISGGARGLRFLSHDRLDSTDPLTKLRAKTLQWALRHVTQLEPWAVGGALVGQATGSEPNIEVATIKTNRSRLFLVQRVTHHEQYLAGDVLPKAVNFLDPTTASSDRAYLVTEAGIVPINSNRKPTNTRIWIDKCPYAAAVVMTQDSLVINHLNSSNNILETGGRSTLDLHSDLTRQWLAIMQLIDGQLARMNRKSSSASGALNSAINEVRQAADMQAKNSPAIAIDHLNQADERIAFAVREIMTEPLGQFKSKTSTPLLLHASLVPLHWQLSERLTEATWNPNSLSGGDFEDLQHMVRYGWENHRSDDDSVTTSVDLTKNAMVEGEFGLRLKAEPAGTQTRMIQATPIWITSGKAKVKAGQMVRIHGWVKIPETITGSQDGLMITDSLGGAELAERVPVTSGWQEFTLYRGASKDSDVTVTFSLTGYGQALIDEVTIRTIDLPKQVREARKSNLQSNQ